MKKLALWLGLVCSLSMGVGATPAQANHENNFGHWNQPPLVISFGSVGFDSVVQDAAYYWQDLAFHRGYYPPLPYHGEPYNACVGQVGRIIVCPLSPGDVRLAGQDGRTEPVQYADGSGHIFSMMIYLNATLSGAALQNVARHEFGHALGLGHRDKPGTTHSWACSLTNGTICSPYMTTADRVAIWSYQPDGGHPQH